MNNAAVVGEKSASLVAVRKELSSFAPNLLQSCLLKKVVDHEFVMEPNAHLFEGCLLICDISGFTRISGTYCSRGKDGLDELSSILKGYLGKLVDCVYQFEGDVINFAGDALICVFKDISTDPNQHTSMHQVCINAVKCAWTLKDIEAPNLKLHVGISCGRINFELLGGYENNWHFLVSGRCLAELSQCLDDAPSKHVAVTETVYNHLQEDSKCCMISDYQDGCEIQYVEDTTATFTAARKSSGNFLLVKVNIFTSEKSSIKFLQRKELSRTLIADDPTLVNMIVHFVPKPVQQALTSGFMGLLAELREVTTAFVKFDSYNAEQHGEPLALQPYLYVCQEILSEHGGFLRQFLVDDKGTVLIALWGVPTATYPDNARRAVMAMGRIRSALAALDMFVSIGITTGVVYCGCVGNHSQRAYCAVGDVVNLSARLMGKADGTILTDETTYSRLPQDLKSILTQLPPMTLKGRDIQIIPYQYIPNPDDHSSNREMTAAPFADDDDAAGVRQVCKDAFMGPLKHLERDRSGSDCSWEAKSSKIDERTQFLVLEGEAGTGREEAVQWLKGYCHTKKIRFVSVRPAKTDNTWKFRAFAKLFRHIMGDDVFDNSKRQAEAVNALLMRAYPTDAETREQVAYPTLRYALGVASDGDVSRSRATSPAMSRGRDRSSSPVVGKNSSSVTSRRQHNQQHSQLFNRRPANNASDPLDGSVSSTNSDATNSNSIVENDGKQLSTKITSAALQTTTATTIPTTIYLPPTRSGQAVEDASISQRGRLSGRERAFTDPGEPPPLLLPKLTPRRGTEEFSNSPTSSNELTKSFRKAKTAPNSPIISPRNTTSLFGSSNGDTTPRQRQQQESQQQHNNFQGDEQASLKGGGSTTAWLFGTPSPRSLPTISPRNTNQPPKASIFSSIHPSSDNLTQLESASITVPSSPLCSPREEPYKNQLPKMAVRSQRWSLESAQTAIADDEQEKAARFAFKTSNSEHITLHREKSRRSSVLSTVSELDTGTGSTNSGKFSMLTTNTSGKIPFLSHNTNNADRLSILSMISVDQLEKDEDDDYSADFVEDLMSVNARRNRDETHESAPMQNGDTSTAATAFSRTLLDSQALDHSTSNDSASVTSGSTGKVSNGSSSTPPNAVVSRAEAAVLALASSKGSSDSTQHPLFLQPARSSSHATGGSTTRGPLHISTTTTTTNTTTTTATTVSSYRKESFVSMSPVKGATLTPQAKIPVRLMVSVLQDIFREMLGSCSTVLAIEGMLASQIFVESLDYLIR